MVVGVVIGPLLAAFVSPGLLKATVFAGSGLLAPAEIVMSNSNRLSPPDGIEFALVQETFGTVPVQVHPAVEPALTTYAVTPAGKVSVSVVVPVEFDGPLL